MDKFEERYKLDEIHRRRMGEKGWSLKFYMIKRYLKYINNIYDLYYLRDLILDYCKDNNTDDSESMSIEDLENDVFNNNNFGDFEDVDNDEEVANLEDELGIDLEQLSTNVYNKEGRNYRDKIAKFITKNYKNCELLRKLLKFILMRIAKVEETYETGDERFDRVSESLNNTAREARDEIRRANDILNRRGGYNDNYRRGIFDRIRAIKSFKEEINKLSNKDIKDLYMYVKGVVWEIPCYYCSVDVLQLISNIYKSDETHGNIIDVIYPYIEDYYSQLAIEKFVEPNINIIKNNLHINKETLVIYNFVKNLNDQTRINFCYNIIDYCNKLFKLYSDKYNDYKEYLEGEELNELDDTIVIERSDLNIPTIDKLIRFINSILFENQSIELNYKEILKLDNLSTNIKDNVDNIYNYFNDNNDEYFSVLYTLVTHIYNILSNIVNLSDAFNQIIPSSNKINLKDYGLSEKIKNADCNNIIVILLMCDDYTVKYLKNNIINIDKIKLKSGNNVIDNHSGFNHKKYGKSRGRRNLHHLLMNEQSEYF